VAAKECPYIFLEWRKHDACFGAKCVSIFLVPHVQMLAVPTPDHGDGINGGGIPDYLLCYNIFVGNIKLEFQFLCIN
jgi:hypothetical protein